MAVTQNSGLGEWRLSLRPGTPLEEVLDRIAWWGHVAITSAREDIRLAGDAVLGSARYVGVLRGVAAAGDGHEIRGAGMAYWLGDEEDKGHVYEEPVILTAASYSAAVAALLPPSVQAGTLHSVAGPNYTGSHRYQTPRKALDYVSALFDAEYRVNGDGTVDAGTVAQLYGTTPRAAVIARSSGTGRDLVALSGAAALESDTEDFTTRVVLLAQTTETSVATGDADIAPGLNPYVDLFGNPVKLTRLISESGTSEGNATARAQLQLNRFTGTRDAVTVNSTTHDVRGHLAYGEYVWCHDLDAGLYDLANEVQWQGETIHPVKLRVTSLTWPVVEGSGVYYRTPAGEWIDLSDYVVFESGQTNITVGGYSRKLVSTGSEPIPVRVSTLPVPNTTVPAAPDWVEPFLLSVYQSAASGVTRAQVLLQWTRPANTDGTAVTDGDYFEIRYRTTSQAILPATHTQMSGYTHAELNTHEEPIPYVVSGWSYVQVSWAELSYLLAELSPGTPYEFQVRVADLGTPANFSAWSASTIVQTRIDSLAPETPAPPIVAGNRLALMVRHNLGQAEGGTFNLALDLNHLEVHAEYEPLFEPINAPPNEGGTMLGKLTANEGMVIGQIPAIGSFAIENTGEVYVKVVAVDHAGNRSRPSTAVQSSAELVDAAHISSIFAETIVSGTVLAELIQGGDFRTAETGARVGFNMDGFYAYDANNELWFEVDKDAGFMRGNWQLGPNEGPKTTFHTSDQTVRWYPVAGSNQRIRMIAYSFDQPDDPSDSPGFEIASFDEIGVASGGVLRLAEDSSLFGHSVAGDWAGYHTIGDDGVHRFRGHFAAGDVMAGRGALFVQWFTVGAGAGGITMGYGATMPTNMNAIVQPVDPDGIVSWTIDNNQPHFCGVAFTGARAIRFNIIAMRTGGSW